MNKNLLICHFFLLVAILLSIIESSIGEEHDLADYDECENPEYVFPWGDDYLNACLGFQCHRVRQHKSWYRFWNRRPKYIHNNINGNEQVIQCSDCEGFLKKGTLFGTMSICTPIEFGGNFETPKGWVSLATASLELNKEVKNKSSIKLVPNNWRIDGETARTTLDLSKCSTSEDDTEVALSILVTLSNIADPSKKSPKYRRILGLSDDSINVRIKTLGVDTGNSMNGFDDEDFDEDDFDEDDFENEGFQQNMVHDDGTNEYFLYNMNKVAQAHHRIPRDPSNNKSNIKRLKTKSQKPFTGAEKLPRKWKLRKGQTSIYSSSDIVRLDLASNLHPNELVQVILTCNNKYMNCNIQDFASCFNILCKSVTKEELIQRAALKKAKQFISDSIITGKTIPIMGDYNSMQFQNNFPPNDKFSINNQHQYPHANNIINLNNVQANSVPQFQAPAFGEGVKSTLNNSNTGMLIGKNVGGQSSEIRGQGNFRVGSNTSVPRMVFVNNAAQNTNINPNIVTNQVPNLIIRHPVNATVTSQNVTIPNVPRMIVTPNQAQLNSVRQASNNLGSLNATVANPQLLINRQQNPCTNKVVVLNGNNKVPNKINISLSPSPSPTATQYILKTQPNQIRVSESLAASTPTKYIIKGLNTYVDQTPVQYNLILDQKPTTTYAQITQPKIAPKVNIAKLNTIRPVEQPQVFNIKLEQPSTLKTINVLEKKNPQTYTLKVVEPRTTKTQVPVQIKLITAESPNNTSQTFKIVPNVEVNQAKLPKNSANTVLLNGNFGAKSEEVKVIKCPKYKILKLEKPEEAPKQTINKIFIKEAPKTPNQKIYKLVNPESDNIIKARVLKKVKDRRGTGGEILELVPVEASTRSKKPTILTDLSCVDQESSVQPKVYLRQVPTSNLENEVILKPIKARPLKTDKIKIIEPDSRKHAYIPDKRTSPKLGEYVQYPNNIVFLEDKGLNNLSGFEFGSNDVGYLSEDEYSTMILKKVHRKNHPRNNNNKPKPESSPQATNPTKQEESNIEEVNVEKMKLEKKNIDEHDCGDKIDNSSVSDSYVYENNIQQKNYNFETRSSMKSILGYSLSISVFLFIVFIIIKLFLL